MDVMDRLWSHVGRREPGTCWEWEGYLDSIGRGYFWLGNRNIVASRAAYVLTRGVFLNTDQFVCHTCDNPRCVNPEHLWLGSVKDNHDDMRSKGRAHHQKLTHCKRGHEYTETNTYYRPDGSGHRNCRTCLASRNKARNRRKDVR